MNRDALCEQLFQVLISGNRSEASRLAREADSARLAPQELLTEIYEPTFRRIRDLHRADQLSTLSHHTATRLLRLLTDQTIGRLEPGAPNNRTLFLVTGKSEADDLCANIAAGLLEAGGFTVTFLGGGIPSDELHKRLGEVRPDILLFFSSAADDLPEIRRLIDELHEEASIWPDMQIVAGGGVFDRAGGLSEEIGADLCVSGLDDLCESLDEFIDQRATSQQRSVGRKRQTRAA